MSILRIVDWDLNHENNRSREISKPRWLALSNNLADETYVAIVDHADGAAHLGAWTAILKLGSTCTPRGLLVKNNGDPYDAESLSRQTRMPKLLFESAIQRFIQIGCLEELNGKPRRKRILPPHPPAKLPQEDATLPQEKAIERTELKGTELKELNGTGLKRTGVNEVNGADLDTPPASRKPSAKTGGATGLTFPSSEEAQQIRTALTEFMGTGDEPDLKTISNVFNALNGMPVKDYTRYLDGVPEQFRPGGRDAPNNFGWFVGTARFFHAQCTKDAPKKFGLTSDEFDTMTEAFDTTTAS